MDVGLDFWIIGYNWNIEAIQPLKDPTTKSDIPVFSEHQD